MGEYKKILFEIFDVLGLSQDEKIGATDIFKKKLAAELLATIKPQLSSEYQQWIADHLREQPNASNPKALEIKNKIAEMFPEKEFASMSRGAFKKLVQDYVNFMSEGLSSEKAAKIQEIVDGI